MNSTTSDKSNTEGPLTAGSSAINQKKVNAILKQLESDGIIGISVDCVIFGFEENELKVLLIRSDLAEFKDKWTLLGDIMKETEDLDDAADRVLLERTGMTDVFLEQVKTFSSPNRHPGGRVITVAYASLLDIGHHQLKITDNELHWHPLNSLKDMADRLFIRKIM